MRARPFCNTTKRAPDNFAASLEIHHAERFAQFEMLLGLERVVALLADRVTLDIAVLVRAVRHVVRRHVGDLRQLLVELVGELLLLGLQRRQRGLELGDFGHQRFGALLVLGLLRLADFLGRRVAPRLRLLEFGDRRAPLSSSASSLPASGASPRRVSPRSKASGCSRIHLMSYMAALLVGIGGIV